jgi:ABC-2 type transport system permease protein
VALLVVSGSLGHRLLTWGPVAQSNIWSDFFLGLLCFVAASAWCTWPLLSAGVDDHSELSLYAMLPVTPLRLFIASLLASMAERRALLIVSPVIGATAGYASTRPPSSALCALLLLTMFALSVAAWARAALNTALNVLRHERNGQSLAFGLLFILGVGALLPPVDASWLLSLDLATSTAGTDVIADAARALKRFPTGLLAAGMSALARGRITQALLCAGGLAVFAVFGSLLAYALMLRFQRAVGRGRPSADAAQAAAVATTPSSQRGAERTTTPLLWLLVRREAMDFLQNPKARLMACVPVVLAVLLKLVSAQVLLRALLGGTADVWLVGGLSVYASVVMAMTFAQNAFGYDGQGFCAFLASPVPLPDVLLAKNIVHGGAAILSGLGAAVFCLTYVGAGGGRELLLASCAVVATVPVLLAAGNVLSVYFPAKFHASLKRRDQLPLPTTVLGFLAVGLAVWPWALLARKMLEVSPAAVLMLMLCSGGLHAASFSFISRLLVDRREGIMHAINRA